MTTLEGVDCAATLLTRISQATVTLVTNSNNPKNCIIFWFYGVSLIAVARVSDQKLHYPQSLWT